MVKVQAKEKARVEIRLPFKLKEELLKECQAEGYDYLSDFIRDILKERLNGKDSFPIETKTNTSVECDFSEIIEAVTKNNVLLLQILQNQQMIPTNNTMNNIVESLLDFYPIEILKQCKTVDDIRELFAFEGQRKYVYDLLDYLENTLQTVVVRDVQGQERLYWT